MRRAAAVLTCILTISAFAASSVPDASVAAERAPVMAEVPGVVPDVATKEEVKVSLPDLELEKIDPTVPTAPEELNLGWTLIRTFVVLGFVIAAIYLTLNFGLRRLMGIAAVPRGQAVVQVVERIPLDQKRAMFVVKAAGEYLLIGGGDGSLQLIAKLDPAEVEKLRVQTSPSVTVSPFLLKLLKRRDVPAPPAPGDHS